MGTLCILGFAGNRCSRILQIGWEDVVGCPEKDVVDITEALLQIDLRCESQFGTLKLAEQTHVPLPRIIPYSGTISGN